MPNKSAKRVLLIADDEPLLLEALHEITSNLDNVEILTAKDGQASLDMILRHPIDAVLSDINMPKKSGLQVLSEIRKKGFETPYVILTGYGDKTNVTEALKLGATDFLEKPFDDEELLKIVDSALDLGVAFNSLLRELKRLVVEKKIAGAEYNRLKRAKVAMTQIRFNNRIRKAS